MDKEALFAPRATTASGMPEDEVEVPGIGTVRVRGLRRDEALLMRDVRGLEATEKRLLAFGMVDPAFFDGQPADLPFMTRLKSAEEDAARWQRAAVAGELEPVANRIAALSGMLSESAKEAVKAFLDDQGAEFRVLPGGEAADAGGPAAGGAE